MLVIISKMGITCVIVLLSGNEVSVPTVQEFYFIDKKCVIIYTDKLLHLNIYFAILFSLTASSTKFDIG